MAGDWIRMRTDLYRDPKVILIAEHLGDDDGELSRYVNQNTQRNMTVTRNVTRNAVVGALVSVWGVARHQGRRIDDDLIIRGVTVSVLDDIADLPGFGEAMTIAGWAEQTGEGVVFPKFFEEHNAELKTKAMSNADRQRAYRERQKAASTTLSESVTNSNGRNGREEKRREREEKSNNTHTQSSELAEAIEQWREHLRMKLGRRNVEPSLSSHLVQAKGSGWTEEKIQQAILFSIGIDAKRLHDPDNDFSQRNAKPKPAPPRDGF